jgi:hypothetical protein
VFAQQNDARVDIDAWNGHAMRFFATRIGLASERLSPHDHRTTDSLVFVVAPDGEPSGLRSVHARPCETDDYELASQTDARNGPTGLALLAERCHTVWLVVREAPSDRLALRLAAILASILLGPILDAAAGELFGVKTARAKLAGQKSRS